MDQLALACQVSGKARLLTELECRTLMPYSPTP